MKRVEVGTILTTYKGNAIPTILATQEKNDNALTKTLTTTTGQEVEITYSERDHRATAYVLDVNRERVVVRTENLSKDLREIHDPIVFNAFLRDAWARTSYSSDGDIRLDVNFRLRGGMMGDAAAASESPMSSPSARDDKELQVLVGELKVLNASNPEFIKLIDKLASQVVEINNIHSRPSKLASQVLGNKPIQNWDDKDIQSWSSEIRKKKVGINEQNLPEVMVVIKQAVRCSEGFSPRDIQIFSLLSLLSKKESHGRLAQIYTGEGKTTTVSMLAVVQALKGQKVDIVTSSEVLAQRDSKEQSKFYSLFGLTSKDNCDHHIKKGNHCYEADIIYGDTLSFEADILYDEYKQYGTRCKRPFHTVIVDEVDSMLIDEKLRMTLLSTPTPGMSILTPILEYIWHVVKLTFSIVTDYASKKLPSVDPAVLVQLYLKGDIDNLKAFADSTTPQYLKEYAASQVINWCSNAVSAFLLYRENEQYVIRDKDIVPVDYQRAGVLQKNMHWGEGLHQFLQMKHDLNVTQINLTTNFLSNVSYFRRYGSNIFGLTGTIGSQSEQELLARLYSLDTVHIPSFKIRRLQEIPGIINGSHVEWLGSVKDNIIEETGKGRAVLVMCETIAKVTKIQNILEKFGYDQKLVHLYTEGSAEEQEAIKRKLLPGQIILATNLAGRGTDLKISAEVEQNGGLHVCVTFLPGNLRVQEQAFGRAGRQGNLGTAQLIIDINDESIGRAYAKCQTIESMKHVRDEKEKRSLDVAMRETQKVINKDTLFTEFCVLNQRISRETRKNKDILAALEERWAIWLLSVPDDHLLKEEDAKVLFSKFKDEILSDCGKDNKKDYLEIIKNPKYYLRQGHKLFDAGRYEEAVKSFEIASRMNPSDWHPKYYQAITNIKLQQESRTLDKDKLSESIEQLKQARMLCADSVARDQSIKLRHQLQRTMVSEEEVQVAEQSVALGSAVQQIEGVGTKASTADRYDNLVRIKSSVLENLRNLISSAEIAHVKGTKFTMEVKETSKAFSANNDKTTIEALRVDGFTKIAFLEKERPWIAIGITALLGIAEVIAGSILCATGVGIPWGIGLIIDGGSDIITSAVSYGTKEFDLDLYVGTKIASMALVGLGCGFLNGSGVFFKGAQILVEIGKVVVGVSRPIVTGIVWGQRAAAQNAKQQLGHIEADRILKEKLDLIKQRKTIFGGPECEKEFDQFEAKCITKVVQVLMNQKDILDYIVCVPSFDKIVQAAYKKANDEVLEGLVSKALTAPIQDKALVGAGIKAFELLEQGGVVEQIVNQLVQELHKPEMNFYTDRDLVYSVANILLEKERGEIQDKLKQKVGEQGEL